MKNPKFTIVVPIYNAESYLRQCIDSIIHQTYTNLEILLIDDGSKDRSGILCDEYAPLDSRIKVYHRINLGVSKSREYGIQQATGDYVMFVDADDWLDVDTVAICINQIRRNPDMECVLFAYCKELGHRSIPVHLMDRERLLRSDEAQKNIHRRLFGLLDSELSNPEKLENMVTVWGKCYRSDLVRKGRFYDLAEVGSCEDGLFNIYALQDTQLAGYIDRTLYHYRKAENTQTSTYRPHLVEQWNNLFSIMDAFIEEHNLDSSYRESLNNRIALSITGIGLNALYNENAGMIRKIADIRSYLRSPRYRQAICHMNISALPMVWKVLLLCSKLKLSLLVFIGITCIRILKNIS